MHYINSKRHYTVESQQLDSTIFKTRILFLPLENSYTCTKYNISDDKSKVQIIVHR